MLTMEILRNTAEKHGFACLLHEKPFAGVNGSGKHNNWSLCDSEGNNLLDPGDTPLDNAQFLVFLAAVLRAVHRHSVALRLGTVGAGNDHRLGANEAPPAILSIFLGEQLTHIVESIAAGENGGKGDATGWEKGNMEVGVSSMPKLPKDISDRNRTSPFAFTGNKFEFRAVGSSQSIAPANIALNAAVACALDDIASRLEAAVAGGADLTGAVQKVLAEMYREHLPIVFNGNGYSREWEEEAARRGLPNLRDTVSVVARYDSPEVRDTFMRHGVLNERELLARQEILFESYIKAVHVETKLTQVIGRSVILPAGLKWAGALAGLAAATRGLGGESVDGEEYHAEAQARVSGLMRALKALDLRHEELDAMNGVPARAEAARDHLLPLMAECRKHADALEGMVDDEIWPLPKYNEMLWQQ